MTSENNNKEIIKVEVISIGAGILSGLYQFKNLSENKMRTLPKLSVCGLTFLLCYSVTNLALKNIHQID